MNGTPKREAAAAVKPCFELSKLGGGTQVQLEKARKIIRAGVNEIEGVLGGDGDAKNAAAELLGCRLAAKFASGAVTPVMLEGMDGATCGSVGLSEGQVVASYVAAVKANL